MKLPPPMKVINFWAGPGAGKSTAAAGLFARMKADDLRVELVTEVAKDMTYDGDTRRLENQLLLLGLQYDRLHRLEGQVDYVVLDSPLPLNVVYAAPRWRSASFLNLTRQAYGHFANTDVLLRRVKPYQSYGRTQAEAEAKALDQKVREVFESFVPTERRWFYDGVRKTPDEVYARLKSTKVIP